MTKSYYSPFHYHLRSSAWLPRPARLTLAGAVLIAFVFACCVAKGADTAFQQAAWDGNVEQVKAMLAAGAKVNDEAYGVRPPLYLTIVQGQQRNTAVAKLLLAAGADPNVEVDDGYPGGRRVVLQTAVGWGNIEIMKALLAAGAKVDHVDKSGQQPIHTAAARGSIEAAKVLLATGARVDAEIKSNEMDWMNGRQPLHIAAFHGNTATVEFLISMGADVNAKDASGSTAVKTVVYGGCNAERINTLKLLIESGAKPDLADRDGRTPLDHATFYKDAAAIRILQAAGAKPGDAVLETAVRNGDVKTLTILAPNFDATNSAGGRLLHVAVGMWCDDNAEMVRFLLAAGADPNVEDEKGRRPLHDAAQYCHPAAVKLLLDAKADFRATDHDGRTALHCLAMASPAFSGAFSWAGEEGSFEAHLKAYQLWHATNFMNIARTLREAGTPVDLAILDKQGKRASDFAKETEERTFGMGAEMKHEVAVYHKRMTAYLAGGDFPAPDDPTPLFFELTRYGNTGDAQNMLTLGAKVNAMDAEGNRPIHIAAANNKWDMVRFLIAKGAEVNVANNTGVQPIHHAANCGYIHSQADPVGLLVKHGAKVTVADQRGRTPLHWLLTDTVEERAKKEGISEAGVQHYEMRIAKALVVAGADPPASDFAGESPLTIARTTEREELVEYFNEVVRNNESGKRK
jgi:ankyrin repeat protein